MKRTTAIFILLIATSAIAQEETKPVKEQFTPVTENVPVNARLSKAGETIIGDFIIESFVELNYKTANPLELDLLIGSYVKIQASNLTGSEIDPMTFSIYEIEKMSGEDYLFRVFGAPLQNTAESLPKYVKVHKTDHAECYGIIELSGGRIAIPYKGVLLFLSRK